LAARERRAPYQYEIQNIPTIHKVCSPSKPKQFEYKLGCEDHGKGKVACVQRTVQLLIITVWVVVERKHDAAC
jgi:hypothetical protein